MKKENAHNGASTKTDKAEYSSIITSNAMPNSPTDHYTLANTSKWHLVELFGLTQEEAKLVHRYRTKLPAIIEAESNEEFCVDLRELHKQLKVKTKFKDWSVRKLKPFTEGKDQCSILSVGDNGGKPQRDHLLTVDTAKHIALSENTDTGRLVRDYFILCEKLLLRMARRNMTRQNCKISTKTLIRNVAARVPKGKRSKSIAEMNSIICRVATGATPSAWRDMLGVKNVRDHLKETATEHELSRYDHVAQMASQLVGDIESTKKSIESQLDRVFGDSDIYFRQLTKLGAKPF